MAASDPLEPPDDPDHMAVLRAKAITAALMYSDYKVGGSEDTRAAFVSRVQDHVEAAGEFGIAQDIDDAVELGQTVGKVQYFLSTLFHICSIGQVCTVQVCRRIHVLLHVIAACPTLHTPSFVAYKTGRGACCTGDQQASRRD